MPKLEAWVKSVAVQVGDVLCEWRNGGPSHNPIVISGNVVVRSIGTSTRSATSAYFDRVTGVFVPDPNCPSEWHIQRMLPSVGVANGPRMSGGYAVSSGGGGGGGGTVNVAVPVPVHVKPFRCEHCESKRCPGTCKTFFK